MRRVALIGGTGAAALIPVDAQLVPLAETPWGSATGPCMAWRRGAIEIVYLPRHGADGRIPPHLVNYRANVHALRELEPDAVIGINAVGGIAPAAGPGRVVLPDQLIDYTWGREHTYFDGKLEPVQHVEFDPPFTEALRMRLVLAMRAAAIDGLTEATYGVTQGPRLETAAEIDRLAADGCHIVGMTALPEAALAREAGLAYAICAVVVNRAAGRLSPGASIHGDLHAFLAAGMTQAGRVIDHYLALN